MGFADMFEAFNHSATAAHDKGDRIIELLEQQADCLAELLDTLRAEDDQDTYQPLTFAMQLDAGGNGAVTLERRPGYVLELVSISGRGAAQGSGIAVFANDTTDPNLLYAGANSTYFSDGFPEGSIVPDGAKLIVQWISAGANANVTVTIRAKRRKLDGERLRVVA